MTTTKCSASVTLILILLMVVVSVAHCDDVTGNVVRKVCEDTCDMFEFRYMCGRNSKGHFVMFLNPCKLELYNCLGGEDFTPVTEGKCGKIGGKPSDSLLFVTQ